MITTLPPLPAWPHGTVETYSRGLLIDVQIGTLNDISEYATAYGLACYEAGQASRLQAVPVALLEALRFYANGGGGECADDDGTSDEGGIARRALCGVQIDWAAEAVMDLVSGPIEGEADFTLAQPDSAPAQADALDAARYRYLRRWTSGQRHSRGRTQFVMPDPCPIGNIMQGSVAQHLDAAIDAEIQRDTRGDGSAP